nr:DUF2383 domain-containing protein [Maribellus comscasis]
MAGYETASNNIEYSDLRTLFLRLSQQRKLFIKEIKNETLKMGIEVDTNGTIKGSFSSYIAGNQSYLQ